MPLAKTPSTAWMARESFQTTALKWNLLARREVTAIANAIEVIEVIAATVERVIVQIVETAQTVATAQTVGIAQIALSVVAVIEEVAEAHLPETSASGAATQVIGKNFITNYKWMEKDEDEIEGVEFQRSEEGTTDYWI